MSEKNKPTVLDLDSNELPLARLWDAGPTLLVFLRQYG